MSECADSPQFENNADFPSADLLNWYRQNKRRLPWRDSGNIYYIWVSEVMLQQTRVATAVPYFQRFIRAFPDINTLAAAPLDRVLKFWEGLGYYSRARNLYRAAGIIVRQSGGHLPADPQALRSLPGIGPYISAAILSIGFNLPVPVVDGNVLRVFARFFAFGADIRTEKTKKTVFDHLCTVIPTGEPGDFNQGVMELGALICRPVHPECDSCPLEHSCEANRRGLQSVLPCRSEKKPVPCFRVSLAVLICGEFFFIQKRPARGHLGGLWEFPGGKAEPGETAQETVRRECREELNVNVAGFELLTQIRHHYTHFSIDVTVFTCHISEKIRPEIPQPFRWIKSRDIEKYAFPRANHKIFPVLQEHLAAYAGG